MILINLLKNKFKLLLRQPGMFLLMTTLSIVMALLVGSGGVGTVQVPVSATDDGVRDSIAADIIDASEAFNFTWMDKQQMTEQINDGKAEMGIELGADDFEVLVGMESGYVEHVKRTVELAYTKQAQYTQVINASEDKDMDVSVSDIEQAVDKGPFDVNVQSTEEGQFAAYDQTHHALFGFTLFFVIYTIGSSVFEILDEKRQGVWDRMILSPVKKWQMYTANFMYSFVIGYFQITLVFALFKYVMGVDFGGRFVEALLALSAYVFAIVALSILLTGLVKTGQQFNAVLSITALAIAMIGGMFWPLEVVQSQVMLGLSKVVPTTYGLEIIKSIVVLGESFKDVLFSYSMLIFMGVLMSGIGIHLMEKRHI